MLYILLSYCELFGYFNDKRVVCKYDKVGNFSYSGRSGFASVLIVGGGGGGGRSYQGHSDPGGGGAGGLVFLPKIYVNKGVEIVVGSGGIPDQDGEDSKFDRYIAKGGGRGGCDTRVNNECEAGGDGGSGGGGGPNNGIGGKSIQSTLFYGYGNAGGHGKAYGNGGAGGGAYEPGGNATTTYCPKGGDGLSEVTIKGHKYDFYSIFGSVGHVIDGRSYFSGGGGGGGECTGYGGKGGGGTSTQTKHEDGLPGSGGGGSGGNNFNGGSGGSGIVLISYNFEANEKTCHLRSHHSNLLFFVNIIVLS
jgi:hypothetical protein